jgi:hypothetical protein
MTEILYKRTPLGQLIYDLGFTRLNERYLARKHRMPVAEVRRLRAAVRRGLRDGGRYRRLREAKRARLRA